MELLKQYRAMHAVHDDDDDDNTQDDIYTAVMTTRLLREFIWQPVGCYCLQPPSPFIIITQP